MADYNAIDIPGTFTYAEWGSIKGCLSGQWRGMHQRADQLDLDGVTDEAQMRGLRRKAAEINELINEIGDLMAGARRAHREERTA